MNAIEAVLFDAGDTLFRLDPSPGDVAPRVEAALGGAGFPNSRKLANRSIDRVRDVIAELDRVGSTAEIRISSVVQAHLLPELGSQAHEAGHVVEMAFAEADVSRFQENTEGVEALKRLSSRGLRLAVVSNTLSPRAILAGHPASAPFLAICETAVFSVEVGTRKPGREIYERVLRQLGVTAASAVFVGDRYREDVAGPEALGIRAALTHQFRREAAPAPPSLGLVSSLGEFADLILAQASND